MGARAPPAPYMRHRSLILLVAFSSLLWLGVRRAMVPAVAAAEEASERAAAFVSTVPADGVPELVLEARDKRGAPVPRLSVRLEHSDQPNPALGVHHLELEAQDGRFELDGLAEGRWRITVEAAPWAVQEPPPREWVVLPRRTVLDVLAVRPPVVDVVVTDATGRPVEGVAVEFHGAQDTRRTVATDAAGRASSGPIPPGPVAIEARRGGSVVRSGATGAPDGHEEVRLRLPGARLGGRVVDVDGSGVERCRLEVVAAAPPHGRLAEVTTDEHGRFHLPHVDQGEVVVRVVAGQRAGQPIGGSATATIAGAGEVFVELRAERVGAEASIAGRVLLQGEPVPDVELTFVAELPRRIGDEPHREAPPTRLTRANREGQYSIELPRSGRWSALVQIAGRPPLSLGRLDLDPAPGGVGGPRGALVRDLHLPVGEIEGRLLDAAGAGLGGATVTALPVSPWTHGPLHAMPRTARTAPDGSFVVGGLLSGSWTLYAEPSASTASRVASQPVDVLGNERGAPIELVSSAGGALLVHLDGLLVDTGDPVRMEVVDVAGRYPFAGPRMQRGALAEGIRIEGLAPGTYRIAGRSSGRVSVWSAPVTVTARSVREVRLTLEPGAELTVVVRDPAGNPVAAAVSVLDEEGLDVTRIAEPRSEALGQYVLGPLAAARYSVVARAVDGTTARREVIMEPSRPFELRLDTGE